MPVAAARPQPGRRADGAAWWPAGRLTGWVAVTLAGGLAVVRALQGPWHAPEPTLANTAVTAGQDFRDATYFPLRELLRGGDPYRPSTMFEHWPVHQEFDLYTPHHLLLQLPLAALSYRPALLAFAVVTIGWLVALAVLAARTADLPGGALGTAALAVVLLLSQVGKSAVDIGQINPLVGLGAAVALTQAGRRERWAALGLALAWIKPQYGIPLSLLLLARGLWRPVVIGTLGALAAALPVLAVLLVRTGLGGFVADVRANLDYANAVPYSAVTAPDGARVDLAAVLVRLAGWTEPSPAVTALQVVVPILVLGIAGVLLARRRGAALTVTEQLLAGLAVLLALVHQPSETSLVLPAVVALLAGRRAAPRRWSGPVLAALLVSVSLVRVSAVQGMVADVVGPRPERLVEGLCLVVAFVVVVGSARRRVPG